jgi:diguanylate cyclase (GGDEF)-like protein/PAS domain S-box-containing protein
MEAMRKHLTGEQALYEVEYRIRAKDGSWRWYYNRGRVTKKDSTGQALLIVGIVFDVTNRKQAEEAIRDSEERYRNILASIEDGYSEVDLAGNMMFFNDSRCRMLGYNADELQGMNYRQYTQESDVPMVFQLYNSVYTSGKPSHGFSWVQISKEGKHIFVEQSVSNITDVQGHVIGFRGISRDISERKQAEEKLRTQYQRLQHQEQALRDSEQRLADVINFLPDPTWVIDQQGQVVFWNKAIEEMTGVAQEQIIGRGNYEYSLSFYGERVPMLIDIVFMSNHDYNEIKRKYDFIRQESHNLSAEIYAPKTYGGKGAYLWASASKLYDHYGNTVGAIQSIRDISNIKQATAELFDEKERFKTTLLSVGDGVISTNRHGQVDVLNKVAQHLTGWTQEEAFGKPMEEVFPIINEHTRARCESPVGEVLDTGKVIEIASHTMLISKTGMERPIEDSAAPIKDEAGNINGVVLVFRDFTEKKERQEKIAYLSYHDVLTGLYNRRFFEEELKRLDTERNLSLTLVMADVNGLKLTNDVFGHSVGDKLLQKAAQVMKKECRSDDIVARIGGDEFILLLPKTEAKEAEVIVQRINVALAREKVESGILSISFGWETKRVATEEMTFVFKKAEDHMYRHKLSESSSMRNKTIKVIINTLYEKNRREEQHSQRVSELCASLGRAMDLSLENVSELRTVGLMHDIGKITLDEKILNKPGKLNESEWLEVKLHSETGYRILSSVNEFSQLAEYVLAHHERWDGKGYPKGLNGEEIPLYARILAVADAYDAMTSNRAYRKALSAEIAMGEIKRNAGIQFDPVIARLLLEKVLGNEW